VTLLFLGTVPFSAVDDLSERLNSVARIARPTTAILGPHTTRLGRSVLCVPVRGLDPLAEAVREAMPGRPAGTPFRGHLTLARARHGHSIPEGLLSRPVAGSWPVLGFSLVSSTTANSGPRYEDLARFSLDG
jgi:2'-5' RNA ligase